MVFRNSLANHINIFCIHIYCEKKLLVFQFYISCAKYATARSCNNNGNVHVNKTCFACKKYRM